MDIRTLADQYEDYIIDRRRWYHACPEVSGEEQKTRAQVKKDLEAMGITEITEMEDCYGLTAVIRGSRPGKTVALRTDIDALHITEETGLPFAATNGNMHACGHDGHIAMLLGAARILNTVRDSLCGNVKLVVEPAEEIGKGGKWMVREGAMDGVDAVYGAHLWGELDAPFVDVTSGLRMAGAETFKITVEGVAAHGSAPHLGVDAITAAAAIINNVQQYASRMNDPLNPLVVTIGTIRGGTRFNVIPNLVEMDGCVRTFQQNGHAERCLRQIVEQTAAALGAKAELEYDYLLKPVINQDAQLLRIAHDAVVKLYGEEGIGHLKTLMGSEDFPHLCQDIPYVFAFIGSRNVEKGFTYTNHHEKYTVDESALKRGAAVMAQFAADYLAENA